MLAGAAMAEPIVFLGSLHNLDYAEVACEAAISNAAGYAGSPYETQPDWVKDLLAGAAECKSVGDPRLLGRRLENEFSDALAVALGCRGVAVYRDLHPDFDPNFFANDVRNEELKKKAPWWDLLLDFEPGKETYGWSLFR